MSILYGDTNAKSYFGSSLTEVKATWIKMKTTQMGSSHEISLNAITSIQNSQTMRLQGEWNGKLVLVLIDLGITHSFVAAKIVK